MKKTLLLIACFFLIGAYSYGQMNTGSLFASATGNFDLSLYSDKDMDTDIKDNHTSFSINPKAGYFIKNRIGVGGMIDFSASKLKYDSGDEYNSTSFIIGPFARYYVEYGSIIPFAEVGVGVGSEKQVQKSAEFTSESKHSQTHVTLGAGADLFLNEFVALEGMIQYFWRKQKPTSEGATGSGHASSGINVNVGLAIYFGSI